MANSSSSQRIEGILQGWIDSGRYGPGMKLPAERDLAAELGVSRMTLRQALESLQFQGQFQRRPGRAGGTFVSGRVPVLELASMSGLAQQLSSTGADVESRILVAEATEATTEVSKALGVDMGDSVLHLRRLRFANEEPVMIEDSCFPERRLPGLDVGSLAGSVCRALGELTRAAP